MSYPFQISVKQLISAIFILVITSCASDPNAPTQIRLVDMEGKPKPTKSYVPELNARILAGQGMKIDQKSGDLVPIDPTGSKVVKPVNTPSAAVAVNQPAVMTRQTSSPNSSGQISLGKIPAASGKVVELNLDASEMASQPLMPKNSKGKKFKIVSTGADSQSGTKNIAAPAKILKKPAGIFIQIGSYDSIDFANQILAKQDLEGRLEEADIKGKKYYRVILGPVSNYQKANNALVRANSAGYKDAFIIKNK